MEKNITEEQKLLKIFLIVKQMFEKSYTKSVQKLDENEK